MLKFFMDKFVTTFILSLLITQLAYSKEPTLAILVNIISNDLQEFKIGNHKFTCSPYGVVTLDSIYVNEAKDTICKQSISTFYKKNLDLKYYVHSKLKMFQSYSLLFKNNQCIVNVEGEKSLSEFLLDVGLAVKTSQKLDREYNFYFRKAEKTARIGQKGLWSENISKECAASLHGKK